MPPPILWAPDESRVERASLTRYARWLAESRGVETSGYHDLWRWSTTDLEGFWASIWEFFEIQSSTTYERVLGARAMPGAEWFPGARLNYAEHVFRGRDDAAVAVRHASELRPLAETTWGELRESTARLAAALRATGIGPGDRVVAYLPNVVEAVVAFHACASLGAVWSSCSPDFGVRSVVDRFAQIEPRVLLAVDGYRYGGRDHDRLDTVRALQEAIPTLERTVVLGYLDDEPALGPLKDATRWDEFAREGDDAGLSFAQVPFDHPLWVLYSSGTTGLPKAIVHGHGGILLELSKQVGLHVDLQRDDRLFWFTTTGWMMWNFLNAALLTEASIVLYDGSPGHPSLDTLWDLAAASGVTCFGTSASYIAACLKDGVEPRAGRDLSRLEALGSTGSPLSPEGFRLGLRPARPGRLALLDIGRHRSLHGVRRRRADAARLPRRAPGARARGEGRGVERRWQAGRRRGRRARDHGADAVDAARTSGATMTARAIGRATSRPSRASGGTATGSRSPSAGRRSSPGARTRRSTVAGSAWAQPRSTARCCPCRRSSTRSSSTCRARGRRGTCRCSWCSETRPYARRRPRRGDPRSHPRGLLAPARAGRDPGRAGRPTDALGQGARGAGQADPLGRAHRTGRQPRLARRSRRPATLRGARRHGGLEERNELHGRLHALRAHALSPHGTKRSAPAGRLTRSVEQLRCRPAARDESGDRTPRVRPRRDPLRPREQLRPALRLRRGDVRAAARDRPRARIATSS